ncbi:MAG: hypothetical protein H0U69_03400 [Trueperaceae bacterium]|nr:hypothetical protein [Trueperaceae bacterium]
MADKKYPPKMQFRTNITERLVFTYGDGKRIPSTNPEYDDSFLYKVTDEEDNERGLFATPRLHEEIGKAGIGKGATADITKCDIPGSKSLAWKIDVIDPGTAVAPRREQAPPQPQADEAPLREAPGARSASRPRRSAQEALAELEAAYTACVEASARVWEKFVGAPGEETLRSTATAFLIQLERDNLDLAIFLQAPGETAGARALRTLIERVISEPGLNAVAEHFGERIDMIPADAEAQRTLYTELLGAVKAQLADEPREEEVEEPIGKPIDQEVLAGLARIRELAEELYGDDAHQGGPNNELGDLIDRIARTQGARLRDLTLGQIKTAVRTLQSLADRAAA